MGGPVANSAGLTSLGIQGFKAARDRIDIAIRPLTLLAGANSSGKSSIVQPLLLMKQTLEASYDPGALELNGSCVRFSDSAQLLWRGPNKADAATRWVASVVSDGTETEVAYGASDNGLILERTSTRSHDGPWFNANSTTPGDEIAAQMSRLSPAALEMTWAIMERRCAHWIARESNGVLTPMFPMLDEGLARDLIHLPGLRGNPERTYRTTRVAGVRSFAGPFPPYVASLLAEWQATANPNLVEVGQDLESLALTWTVATRRPNDTEVEVRVGRTPAPIAGGVDDLVNIADVGFGVSQVLPVVVALRAAEPDQVVHIEQPELHLHPNAQAAMADLLVAAAKRGVRLIVETHSSILLTRVLTAVARNDHGLTPDDVALHWFTRDDEGVSRVRTAQIGDDGSYGDWPVDFAEVEMRVDQEYVDASFARLASRPTS